MKKTGFLLAALILCLECMCQPAICAYKYRKRITFDPARVMGSVDLQNFPVLITFTTSNDLRTVGNGGHVENPSGFDIVFTADDGVTLLSFQRERHSASNGQYTAWVKIPVLSTSQFTSIYMYYGNSATNTDQSSNTVWSNYHGVWHLENGSFADASSNSYNLTNNSTTNQSPAYINDGRALNGTHWLEVANTFPNLNTGFTMSAWVYTTDNTRAGQRIFCDDVNNTGGYAMSIGDNGTGTLRFFSRGSNPVYVDAPNLIANNTWYYITGVADITNSTRRLFINGVQVASDAFSGWSTDNGNASIGGETAGGETGNRLAGRIDEVRVAKSALSADWLLTEYNNQSSPSTFYAITSEPARFTGGSSTWNTNGNWASGSVPAANSDIILSGAASQPALNTDVQITSLWVLPSTTLTLNNGRTMSLTRDITNCGVITGNNNSDVNLNSTSSTAQNQYLSGSGTYNLEDLTINNTFSLSPMVVLNRSVTVNGNLTLTSGIVSTTSANILALVAGAASTDGSASSFVSGPMSKDGNTSFIFPVGKGNRWRRLRISNFSGGSSNFRAEYFNSAYTSTTPVNAPLDNVSSLEYWQLDRLTGSASANVALYWEDATVSGINNCTDLTIARWNNTAWDERAASTLAGSTCSGSGTGTVVTTSAVSAFSPFTFGSKLAGANPLPVELIDFTGQCEDRDLRLKWATASEHRNDHFRIEYSPDADAWQLAGTRPGAGNSAVKKEYELFYKEAAQGYYRLVQVDEDGTQEVFKVLYFDCFTAGATDKVTVYPNPSEQDVTFEFSCTVDDPELILTITDCLGKACYSETLRLKKGMNKHQLDLPLQPGVYSVSFSSARIDLPVLKLILK